MACAVESVVSKLLQTLGMEFRLEVRTISEKSKSSILNRNRKELKVVKSFRVNRGIRILQVHKGNCTVVLDESEYKDKLNNLLKSGVYEPIWHRITGGILSGERGSVVVKAIYYNPEGHGFDTG
jgi:hypothetical protein